MEVNTELYISTKSENIRTGYYGRLKYGYVYADFVSNEVANCILSKNPDLDFVMVISDYVAYLYTNKDYVRVEAIARDYGGKLNSFPLKESEPKFFIHKKLFRVTFLGGDRNTYYKDVEGEDRAEAEYNFHKNNYGEIVKCEFIKYVD